MQTAKEWFQSKFTNVTEDACDSYHQMLDPDYKPNSTLTCDETVVWNLLYDYLDHNDFSYDGDGDAGVLGMVDNDEVIDTMKSIFKPDRYQIYAIDNDWLIAMNRQLKAKTGMVFDRLMEEKTTPYNPDNASVSTTYIKLPNLDNASDLEIKRTLNECVFGGSPNDTKAYDFFVR